MNKYTNRQLLNISRFKEVSFGDADLERKLIVEYLRNTRINLTTIETGLSNNVRIKQAAKGIETDSERIGAETMREKAFSLEEQANGGNLIYKNRILSELKEEFNQVLNFFLGYLNTNCGVCNTGKGALWVK